MKPTILEPVSATSSSLFLTALRTDPIRPELGFQANHSERRLSTARASVIKALLATSPLNKPHRGPSSIREYLRHRIKPRPNQSTSLNLNRASPLHIARDAEPCLRQSL